MLTKYTVTYNRITGIRYGRYSGITNKRSDEHKRRDRAMNAKDDSTQWLIRFCTLFLGPRYEKASGISRNPGIDWSINPFLCIHTRHL